MEQLTMYNFGVKEPEDGYSWLFITKFDTKELPITINHVDKMPDTILGSIKTEEAKEPFKNLEKYLKKTSQAFIQERVDALKDLGYHLLPKRRCCTDLFFSKICDLGAGEQEQTIRIYKDSNLDSQTDETLVEKYTTRVVHQFVDHEFEIDDATIPFTTRELELVLQIMNDPYWTEFKC